MVPALQKISSCSLHSSDLKIERVSFCRAQTHEGSTFLGIKSNFPTKMHTLHFSECPMKLGKSTKRYREGSERVLSIPAISINEGFKEAPPSQRERQHWARAGRSTSESQCLTMYLEKLTRQYFLCNQF